MTTGNQRSTTRPATAVAVTVLLATTGCGGGDGAPEPPAPTPTGAAARVCRALHSALPDRVDGQRRVGDTASRYTAEWGDPPIRLRCGVPRPKVLAPGSEHYNPTADAAEVNGVTWLLEQRPGGYRFTTTDRAVYVEVTVPDAYRPEINALPDLAAPLRRHVPKKEL